MYHGNTTENHGNITEIPRKITENHGTSRKITENHGKSRKITEGFFEANHGNSRIPDLLSSNGSHLSTEELSMMLWSLFLPLLQLAVLPVLMFPSNSTALLHTNINQSKMLDGSTMTNNSSVQLPTSNHTRGTSHFLEQCARDVTKNATLQSHNWKPLLPGYRLGDCIKLLKHCGSKKQWGRDTLAVAYSKNTKNRNDRNLVMKLIDAMHNSSANTKPEPNALVIHLRLGDVIEKSRSSAQDMLLYGGTPKHHKNFNNAIKPAHELLEAASHAKPDHVYLVAGAHSPLHPRCKSWPYANCVHRVFQYTGYNTSLIMFKDPDQAFVFMQYAKKFVVGVGGYSRIIAFLVRLRGGVVFGRTF